MGKSLADIRAELAGAQVGRKKRKLTKVEAKRLTKLEGLLERLQRGKTVQNRTLQTWLTDDEYVVLVATREEQQELRDEFAEKPQEIVRYEALLKAALFTDNRAESFSQKGNFESARKLRNIGEGQFEKALEHLEENLAVDPQLQLWLDREFDCTPAGNIGPSADEVPRVVTSRSASNNGGGFLSMFKAERDLKIEAVQRAIDGLKYED